MPDGRRADRTRQRRSRWPGSRRARRARVRKESCRPGRSAGRGGPASPPARRGWSSLLCDRTSATSQAVGPCLPSRTSEALKAQCNESASDRVPRPRHRREGRVSPRNGPDGGSPMEDLGRLLVVDVGRPRPGATPGRPWRRGVAHSSDPSRVTRARRKVSCAFEAPTRRGLVERASSASQDGPGVLYAIGGVTSRSHSVVLTTR